LLRARLLVVIDRPPVFDARLFLVSVTAGGRPLRGASELGCRAVGLSATRDASRLEFVSQEFFNEHACGGRRCRVWGWYPNTGKNVIYVHEAVRELVDDSSDPRSLLAASIIVHEFTHYLQAAKRGFARYECNEALELEHEAYTVQNAYLAAYGRYMQVGLAMHNAGCVGSAGQTMFVPSDPRSSNFSP
jgi:hypothetical protein